MTTINLATPNGLTGWVLVEAHLDPRYRQSYSSLRARRRSRPGKIDEFPMPVMLDGRIVELVELPGDVEELDWRPPDSGQFDASQISIRRVGLAERIVRMAIRVARTCFRIPDDLRREANLTLWRCVRDLAGAYRIASVFRLYYPLFNYADWIERFDTLDKTDVDAMRARSRRFANGPRFHLLLTSGTAGPDAVRYTLASLHAQIFRNFSCTLLDDAGTLGASFDPVVELKGIGTGSHFVAQSAMPEWIGQFNAARGSERPESWVILMQAGDALPAHSLYWFACEIQARPDAVAVYSDDDVLDADGQRGQPRFKPDWSLEHLRSTHYIGAAAALRGSAFAAVGGITAGCCRHGNYDLLLRIIDAFNGQVAHVPAILFHRVGDKHAGAREDPQWCAAAVRAHLARNRIGAEVEATHPRCRRVRYHLAASLPASFPLVSIIVPTRDAVSLLRQCVDSVLAKTTYPRYEILIVDNQSAEPETLAWFEKIAALPNVRVLRYDHPFNYSKLNNFAAREARGELLCLLNNDIEVISPDWLDEMTGHILQKQVGIVGAKLLYPDGRVQHAGTAVGPGGCANHVHLFIGRNDAGYCGRAVIAQEFSAVTAACLLTWKSLYERLGGLNEEALTVAFNDVDYCLRVQEAGQRVIFTPHAELYHHESASRGRDDSLRKRLRANREVRYMRTRWTERLKHDPYYNLNLSYWRPDFSLTETLRVKKPWL